MAVVSVKIRVTFPPSMGGLPLIIAEQLRYAGVIKYLPLSEQSTVMSFDLYPPMLSRPTKENQRKWAETNAERIRSFGIAAHVFPV